MCNTKLFIALLFLCCPYALEGYSKLDQHYDFSCVEPGSVPCKNGGCFQEAQRCDGFINCEDGTDEQFCVTAKTDPLVCNVTHQFLCADGLTCVPNYWICNGHKDCTDGSDEANCTGTLPINKNVKCKGFTCDDGKCISDLWVCDGIYDCDDKSDELRLDLCRAAKSEHLSLIDTFCYKGFIESYVYKCLDWRYCVNASRMCDGIIDCRDASDEGNFCNKWETMCNNVTCYGNNTICVPERNGPICACEPDSDIAVYNYETHKCEDVDECIKDIPQCSHICVNRARNFRCECEPGYTMDLLQYLCYAPAPEAMLFFSTPNDIRYIKIMSKQTVTLATGLKKAHGVVYDGSYVYWVETAKGHQAIFKAHLDNIKDTKQILAGLGVEDPDSIAIDYMGENIYFSDSERGIISACKTDGSVCTTIKADTNRPKFVTLNVRDGKMYWADWMSRGVILMANMDGSNTTVLVDRLESYATGLALDIPNDRLYYVDGTIRAVILSQKRGYTFLNEPFHHPYSIAVFENTVYWSDWTTNTIQMTDKVHGTGGMRNLLLSLNTSIIGMHIYHPIQMNKTNNPCRTSNCSHFCFPTSNSTYACGCPDGMGMRRNVCIRVGDYRAKYVVIAEGHLFTRMKYDEVGNPVSHATRFNIGRVQAMAYNRIKDVLYIYDSKYRTIRSIYMKDFLSGLTQSIVEDGLENVVDMEFEYASDNLYILDAGRRLIEVYSSKSRKRTEVYKFDYEETPISFCLMPDYGRMMIAIVETDHHNNIHIDSMGLDGSSRRHVLSNNLKGPHIRLRYVQAVDNVYIADESNGVIDYIHPDGKGKENYRTLSTTIYSLAVTENIVFWTDRRTPRIFWSDIHDTTQKIRRMDLSVFPNNTQLLIESTSPPLDETSPVWSHPCYNGACADFCVPSSHEDPNSLLVTYKYRCLCSPGYAVRGGTCVKVIHCREDQVTCHRSNMCLAKEKICNGKPDCPLGEDEEGCTPVNTEDICTAEEFFCGGVCLNRKRTSMCNGRPISEPLPKSVCTTSEYQCANSSICIARSQLCDKKTDCPSGDDELVSKCDTLSCFSTEFMCSSGSCISKTFVCDGEEDCSDGSDESNCGNVKCGPGFFQCRSRDCVEASGRCNGKQDCLDFSDEEDCEEPTLVDTSQDEVKPQCAPWEYSCEHNTSICLPSTARCNRRVECPGGSDETGCGHGCAERGQFSCLQQLFCISMKQVCNNRRDCFDGSDETPEACSLVNKTSTLFPINTYSDCAEGFKCGTGQCIEWTQVCDNKTDCYDKTDENEKCITACKNAKCSSVCKPTPTGPHCTCPVGYHLGLDNYNCDDIDECEEDVCSQICFNTPGSFSCACHHGYAPRADRRSCKSINGSMSIFYASGNIVRSLSGNGSLRVEFKDEQLPTISDMDMDVRQNKLYLSVPEANALIEVTAARNVIKVTNIGKPSRVTLDWVTGNVYFVDDTPSFKQIRVCHIIQMHCAKLQRLPSDANVTALVVDPSSHRMFYCLTRELESVVWSASLTGALVTDLTTVRNCTGLAVDPNTKKLYVAESGPGHIIRMDYEGDSHKKVLEYKPQLREPHSLAIFEDHIYYLEANTVRLGRCLTFGHKHCDSYSYRFSNATSFVVRHENIQTDDLINGCEGFSCPNICALDEFGPKCICPNGDFAMQGQCSDIEIEPKPLFNGHAYQDPTTEKLSTLALGLTISLVILVLVLMGCCVAIIYKRRRRIREAAHYAEVRFHNRERDSPESSREPSARFGEGPSSSSEFVNPIQFVKNVYDNIRKHGSPEPPSDLEVIVPTSPPQPDTSDTESDLDDKESPKSESKSEKSVF